MLRSNVERMTTMSTVQQRPKKSASIVWTVFPNAIKMYSQDVGGVDLVYQSTTIYKLDCKSSIRFCLRIFLDSMNMACANSFIVYNMHSNELTLLDFKTIISTYLVGCYTNRSIVPPKNKIGSKRKYWSACMS